MCQPRICALLVASVILGFAAHPLQSNPHEYGVSSRPSPIPRLHMTEGVSEKHLLKKVEPDYPPEANSRRLEGDVVLALGAPIPTGAELARGLDFTWRFMMNCLARWGSDGMKQAFPDEEDGKPVEVETFATVRFRLARTHW